jgi:hypothetical protein
MFMIHLRVSMRGLCGCCGRWERVPMCCLSAYALCVHFEATKPKPEKPQLNIEGISFTSAVLPVLG